MITAGAVVLLSDAELMGATHAMLVSRILHKYYHNTVPRVPRYTLLW